MKYRNGICKINVPFRDLRREHKLTLKEFGAKVGGYHRETVFNVEHGNRYGNIDFWIGVQQAFDIPDEDMWYLILGKHKWH